MGPRPSLPPVYDWGRKKFVGAPERVRFYLSVQFELGVLGCEELSESVARRAPAPCYKAEIHYGKLLVRGGVSTVYD